MTDQELIYRYQERIAICCEDGYQPLFVARKTASEEIKQELIQNGYSNSEAVLKMHEIRRLASDVE